MLELGKRGDDVPALDLAPIPVKSRLRMNTGHGRHMSVEESIVAAFEETGGDIVVDVPSICRGVRSLMLTRE